MFLLGLKRCARTSMWPWTEPWMLPLRSRYHTRELLTKRVESRAARLDYAFVTTRRLGWFNPLFNEYKLEGCLNFHHNSQTVQLGPVAPLSGVYINRVSSEVERREQAVAFWRCVVCVCVCVRATTDRFKSSSELLTRVTKTFRSACLPCRGQECPPHNGDCK